MEHSGPTPAQLITDDTLLRSLLAGAYRPLSDGALHRAADQANQGYGAARIAEIMRLQAENASLRSAYAELESRYAALFTLHAAHPVVLVDAADGFPSNALRHSA